MRRFFSLVRRSPLCSTSEEAVVTKKGLVSFPINGGRINSENYSSETLTDFDDLFDDENDDDDTYPWAPASESSSPPSNKKSRKPKGSLTGTQHPWTKLVDTEDEIEFSPERKPKVLGNIHLAKSEAFQANFEQFEAVSPTSPAPIKPDETKPKHDSKAGGKPAAPRLDFPVQEIKRHRRQVSDCSDVSSLSEPRQVPLEYNLENGFKNGSEFYHHLSEDIVRSLERTEYGQAWPMNDKFSSKCLILLMDPSKKLFEIVQVPYEPNKTTVGEMMHMLKDIATDSRLARQAYTGLAFQGMHICAPMVPVDVILEAEATRKPLLAVPANYSAGQVELFGKTLLEIPSVARLLEDQLARLEASRSQPAPLPTSIDMKVPTKISPRQGVHHEPSMVYAQSSQRFLRI